MVGNFQNTYSEVNLEYVKANGISVVRRMSGGGTIYTDMGSWQFTFITKSDAPGVSFTQFITPVAQALRGFGLDVSVSGRNDLTIDGKKFSGNAQCIRRGYTLHHGSILFETDIEQMVRSTTVDEEKIIAKGIKSVRERVVNISGYFAEKPSMQEFKRMMMQSITKGDNREYQLSPEEITMIENRAKEKFDNWQAIYGSSPQCSMTRKKRFPGGGVEINLDIAKGRIQDIGIFGDFFGTIDIAALCERLRGCLYREDAVRECLTGFYAEDSIYQISIDDMVSAVVED
jgi:lipoate-protein ligase A